MRSLVRKLLGLDAAVSPELQAYRRLAAKGFRPGGIIDVGAYEGGWTRLARSVFPEAPVLMVEAQAAKLPLLRRLCESETGVSVVEAVLAARGDEAVTFYEMETGSSIRAERSNVARVARELRTTTLDTVARGFGEGLFLKLDVQGAELDVLAGGSETVARCSVIQLETALLPYNEGAPQLAEVVAALKDMGFVAHDFAGFIRPNGADLIQVDVVFVREDSPLRPREFVY